jgi:hypothetical protein
MTRQRRICKTRPHIKKQGQYTFGEWAIALEEDIKCPRKNKEQKNGEGPGISTWVRAMPFLGAHLSTILHRKKKNRK